MASQKAEDIREKFRADRSSKLTASETRYWARLRRVYDGDLDAFDRPDQEMDRSAEEMEEDEEIARIMAQIEAANTETVEGG